MLFVAAQVERVQGDHIANAEMVAGEGIDGQSAVGEGGAEADKAIIHRSDQRPKIYND